MDKKLREWQDANYSPAAKLRSYMADDHDASILLALMTELPMTDKLRWLINAARFYVKAKAPRGPV